MIRRWQIKRDLVTPACGPSEVEEVVYNVDVDTAWLDIESDLDAKSIATNVGKLVDLKAYLMQRRENAEVALRKWKAERILECKSENPKMPEWEAKARYQSAPKYVTMYGTINGLNADIAWLDGIIDGLQIKSYQISGMRKDQGTQRNHEKGQG